VSDRVLSSTGLSEGAIWGISLGSIALLVLICVGVYFCFFHKKSNKAAHYEAIEETLTPSQTIQGEDQEDF
jgi:hypothetical protein